MTIPHNKLKFDDERNDMNPLSLVYLLLLTIKIRPFLRDMDDI